MIQRFKNGDSSPITDFITGYKIWTIWIFADDILYVKVKGSRGDRKKTVAFFETQHTVTAQWHATICLT
jgi:hypothetical protein